MCMWHKRVCVCGMLPLNFFFLHSISCMHRRCYFQQWKDSTGEEALNVILVLIHIHIHINSLAKMRITQKCTTFQMTWWL